jgi:mono/diheme cytochrome c family protein
MRPNRTVNLHSILSLSWLWLAAVFPSACAARTQVLTPSPVEVQLSRGAQIYARDCATAECHGTLGEGLRQGNSFSAWPLMGSDFETRNPNAQVIFDVVRSGSEANLRALSDQQIYAVTAYELSLNGISLPTPLNAENAARIASGETVPAARWGELFPPPGNTDLLPPGNAPGAASRSTNGSLDLRVDQMALASRIGNASPSSGGVFVILVLAFQNLEAGEAHLDPSYLSLVDAGDQAHQLEAIRLDYPIEAFHPQIIQPEYGTAAVAIFSLPQDTQPRKLIYQDPKMPTILIDLQN